MAKAKSKELAVVEPVTSLSTPEILAQVDMKLSKSDLIELVIEEKKETLETSIEEARKLKHVNNEELMTFKKKTSKEVVNRFIKKQSKLVNAFTKAFPQNTFKQFDSCSEDKVSFQFMEREDLNKKPGERKVRSNPLSYKHYREDSIDIPAMVDPVLLTSVQLEIRSSCGNVLRLGEGSIIESDILCKAVIAVQKKQEDALRLEESLKLELANLSKRGGKVRADLTRSILAKSADGSQLLTMLETLKKSMK